jgi:histone deacetylase 1/2
MSAAERQAESDVAKSPGQRPRVDYFYDEAVGNYHYGAGHPMRPHRVRLTHNLLVSYGLYKHLNVFRPKHATYADLTAFHTDEYIDFLKAVTPENMTEPLVRQTLDRFNICEDCPVFDGLYEYCQTYTGGSLGGAARLNQGAADVVVNWAGGLHHAKKGEASGFCYTNDIVLAILELLKVHPRVLYVDIDIHHGDGVEEAFYLTNRVLTLSFHQSGASFFPRTGHLNDTGGKRGAGYSLNFPLHSGMDDVTYKSIFQPVIAKVFETFAPTAVVMCCGADSLSGDRVGVWNLSIKGHAAVIEYIKVRVRLWAARRCILGAPHRPPRTRHGMGGSAPPHLASAPPLPSLNLLSVPALRACSPAPL